MPDKSPPSRDEITDAMVASVQGKMTSMPAPIDEALWERRMKALTLRNLGGTYSMIATECGVHPATARADVRIAMREVLAAGNEERLARQLSVLLDMQHGAYPAAMQGDKDSIMAIVRCLEQEAKLCGMYAPAKTLPGISDTDFAAQAVGLFERLGMAPPRELLGGSAHGGRPAAIDAEVSEVIDGVIERVSVQGVLLGFDMVARDFAVDDESAGRTVERAISEETISRAAAEAITGGEQAPLDVPWSNL